MTRARVRWDSDPVKAAATKAIARRMLFAVKHVEGAVKRLLSRSQPTASSRTTYGVGFRKKITVVRRRGLDPSLPGESPKKVTGVLRSSIVSSVVTEPGSIIGIVGVLKGPATVYARRLELGFVGTDRRGRSIAQLPRPFLRRGLVEEHQQVVKILNREG